MTLSFRATFALVVAMFLVAGIGGVSAGTYDDMLAKQVASQERAAKKLARLEACAANPKPCAEEDAAKAAKAVERAQKKLDMYKAALSSN